MRIALGIIGAVCLCSAVWSQAAPGSKEIIGSWEGESKCAVPDSQCHDEHALYRIAANKKDPSQLNLDGYKIVEGSPEFMGTLLCRYRAESYTLSCAGNTGKQDDWEFHLSGDSMTH